MELEQRRAKHLQGYCHFGGAAEQNATPEIKQPSCAFLQDFSGYIADFMEIWWT